MVKLNTELTSAALVQLAQTETNKFIVSANTRPRRTAAVPRMLCPTAARYPLRLVPVFLLHCPHLPGRTLPLLFFGKSRWQGPAPPGRIDCQVESGTGGDR